MDCPWGRTRLRLCLRDPLGRDTGRGCHFLLQGERAYETVKDMQEAMPRVIKDHGEWDKLGWHSGAAVRAAFCRRWTLETRDLFSRMPRGPEILTSWELPHSRWWAGRQRMRAGLGLWRPEKKHSVSRGITGPGPTATLKPVLAPEPLWPLKPRGLGSECPGGRGRIPFPRQPPALKPGHAEGYRGGDKLTHYWATNAEIVIPSGIKYFARFPNSTYRKSWIFDSISCSNPKENADILLCWAKSLRRLRLFATSRTTAGRAPLSRDPPGKTRVQAARSSSSSPPTTPYFHFLYL